MQFYIIHEVPAVSAEMLPDYAIKKVNVREGYQILSDIGHALGITWEGQNKCYNSTHPITLRFYQNYISLYDFLRHYEENLKQYELRFGKRTVFHERYTSVPIAKLLSAVPKNDNKYETIIRYILKHKSKHLTEPEIMKLWSCVD